MTEEKVSPLRQRMIEDMNIRGLGDKTQKAHTRNVNHFAAFLGRSPDTATPEELRPYHGNAVKFSSCTSAKLPGRRTDAGLRFRPSAAPAGPLWERRR
jgi:hypothetical protein